MNHYDDEMTERAAYDFLCQATREGRSENDNSCPALSRRFGNLVTIYGMSNRIAYYPVFKHSSGAEYVRPLADASEDNLCRLVRGA